MTFDWRISPFTFKVIIGRHRLTIAILLFPACFVIPLFLYSSLDLILCGLMVFYNRMLWFLSLYFFCGYYMLLPWGYHEVYIKYTYYSLFCTDNNLTLNTYKALHFYPPLPTFSVSYQNISQFTSFYIAYPLINYYSYRYF